jgi:hypothetical protein
MRIKDEKGVLRGFALTPTQRAFILRISRLVPEEQSRITRYVEFVKAERRDEATLMAERILTALPDDDPNRSVVAGLLFARLDELE